MLPTPPDTNTENLPMSDLILHHYLASPYSEKIRAVLGYKELSWHSVLIPPVMPKQELMPLTGGYRKTPVLQVGRDVICDSALIVRVLDRLHPDKPIVLPEQRANCLAWAALEQTLFFAAVATNFQTAGLKAMAERMGPQLMEVFGKDRKDFFVGGAARRPSAEFGKLTFLPQMNAIDVQLAAGAPFLLGNTATLADFVAYHPTWFVRTNQGMASTLEPFKNLLAWFDRIKAFGHGRATELEASAALQVAYKCDDWLALDGPLLEPEGISLGQAVVVRATDYGVEPVEGALVHASVFEVVVQRRDPLAGEVRVHFPRAGFSVTPVQTH